MILVMEPLNSGVLSPLEIGNFLNSLLLNMINNFIVDIFLMDVDCNQSLDLSSLKFRFDVFQTHICECIHDIIDIFCFLLKFRLLLTRALLKAVLNCFGPDHLDT